ncbi:c-type cytochrome [Faucicola mancuniensis]|uniref:c-type cytochrome n=1 Tax=Faucicola mancuniensis TaxID=1309795 RepID=UPI0039772834
MLKKVMKISGMALVIGIGLVGCEKQPPSERPAVSLPVYTQGDSVKGKTYYDQECEQCHKLVAGNNKKGPQLSKIYGAKSALLTDYQYTDALKNSQITWDSTELDRYIANPKQAINGTRMRSDPINDKQMRQDIIAYISTLR